MPLYIPLDAVFEKGGRTLVYRMEGGTPMEQEVTLGGSNENYVVVEEGLGPNDRVALRDPTTVLEELWGHPRHRGIRFGSWQSVVEEPPPGSPLLAVGVFEG